MKDFKGRVAVITGGASGIGRAMAERFAEEGMKIVLADVEESALAKTEAEMRNDGAEVTSLRTDVTKSGDVTALAEKTLDAYGGVHVVCNNAGVGIGGPMWAISEEDWEWVLGVNLWGVIHGIRAFVPAMLEAGSEGHIVNTSSMAGLTSGISMAPYHVSKHGVVTLSECLHHELRMVESKIRVSVLCPGWVNTAIVDSDRNRPGGAVPKEKLNPMAAALDTMVRTAVKDGLKAKDVAQLVFEAIQKNQFYILPHAHWNGLIRTRMEDILEQRDPTPLVPPDAMA